MDLMNRVFRNYLELFVIFLIDDILVYSKSESDRMSHFRIGLQVLKDNKLFAEFNKCELLLRLVAFLCHVILGEGIEFNQKKSKEVNNWPRPQKFIGLARYYRRFVDFFHIFLIV